MCLLFSAALASAGFIDGEREASPNLSSDDARVIEALLKPAPTKGGPATNLVDVPSLHLRIDSLPRPRDPKEANRAALVPNDDKRIHHAIQAFNADDPTRFAAALFGRRNDLAGLPSRTGKLAMLSENHAAAFAFEAARTKSFEKFGNNFFRGSETDCETWLSYLRVAGNLDASLIAKGEGDIVQYLERGRIAALTQILATHPGKTRMGMVAWLASSADPSASVELARIAVFADESPLRNAAIEALRKRKHVEYEATLFDALRYPFLPVAERAAFAIAELGRSEWIEKLIAMKGYPDPRLPQRDGGRWVVRELVRINHTKNCLICHPPVPSSPELPFDAHLSATGEVAGSILAMGNRMPPVSASLPTTHLGGFGGYFSMFGPNIRFDVTFLRQDFSRMMPDPDDKNAGTSARLERFDFLVRRRTLSHDEATAFAEDIRKNDDGNSPYADAYARAIAALQRKK